MKKVFFINRSFYPDIEATGQFYTELCEELKDKFDITFICGLSYYIKNERFRFFKREKFKNIKIIRVKHTIFWKGNIFGRVINWITFCFNSFLILYKIKPEILICGTDPPLLGIISYILKKLKNIKYIYSCNDLYPDIAVSLNTLKNKFLIKFFDYLNKKAFKNSLKIVSLGEDMKELIVKKGINKNKVIVITNWVDTKKIYPLNKEENIFLKKYNLNDEFILIYSGNIGLPHNLENLIYAFEKVNKKNWKMIFIGDGVKKDEILKLTFQKNLSDKILFLPYQPKEFLIHSLNAADLHVVSLKKEAKGACVPSKIYAIIGCGKPFLSISDEDSNSSIIAKKYNCGIVADPESVEDIKDKIEWAIENKEKLKELGENARKVAISEFDKEIVIRKWENLIKSSIYD